MDMISEIKPHLESDDDVTVMMIMVVMLVLEVEMVKAMMIMMTVIIMMMVMVIYDGDDNGSDDDVNDDGDDDVYGDNGDVLMVFQDSIQRVLLKLATSLSTEHRIQEKRRILTMYQLFVEMLLPEFASTLGGSWGFILRDVIHRLVHVIKDINTQHR